MRQSVEVSRTIAAPPWAVWGLIGGFDLGWHPDVADCRVEGPLRRVRMTDGNRMTEHLHYRSATQGRLAYGLQGSDYRAELLCQPEGDATRLIWRANPEPDSAGYVRGLLGRGLAAIAERLELTDMRFGPQGRLAGIGAGQGPLAILLHGIGGTKENWRDQLFALAPSHRAIALDMQGYGDSAETVGPMTLAGLIDDLSLVLSQTGADRAHLIGLSFGAWLAASFAMTRPERVASLTCSGGFLGMTEAPEPVRANFLSLRLQPLDAGESPGSLAPAVWDRLKGPVATSNVEQAFLASMRAIPASAYRKALHCFTSPPFTLNFSRLTMPVLTMTGAHDALASPAEIAGVTERLRTSSPHVRHEVIEGAGHLCNMEQPHAYNRHLTAFLKGLPR